MSFSVKSRFAATGSAVHWANAVTVLATDITPTASATTIGRKMAGNVRDSLFI